ncbi:hypothetical protein [Arcicella lustrica]|uniref:Uncharacterized protein n=1 Tax=Arcicella lustrica TaxID=2984196 RepID=A0ABU5SPR7_9BACT|nr:hypothetical protein [Arcicella sp. DC25W]MEA5429247.1 hypothetical protein [Arcicella sp. DC25W]
MKAKRQKIFTIFFWALISLTAYYFYNNQSKKSIIQYDSLKDPNDYLDEKLNWILDPNSNKEGRADFIMRLNDTAGKLRTELWITEGEFDSEKVNPYKNWEKLLRGKNAIIVNSPDEKYSCDNVNDNSLVSKVCQGCNITELENKIKNPGDVIITECNGKYKANGLFTYVANAIVVNWQYLDSVSNVAELNYDNDIQAIWKDNAQRVISNLFTTFQNDFNNKGKPIPEVLVFTGVGTNIGNVPIDFLYRNFFRILDSNYHTAKILPEKIFINLYRKQIAENPSTIFYSLRNGFLTVNSSLSKLTVKRYETEWLEILGLCLGILFLLLSIQLFIKRDLLKYSQSQIDNKIFLISVGHFLMGYGFLKILEKVSVIDSFLHSHNSTFLYLALGFIAVPFSFIIPYSKKLTKQSEIDI